MVFRKYLEKWNVIERGLLYERVGELSTTKGHVHMCPIKHKDVVLFEHTFFGILRKQYFYQLQAKTSFNKICLDFIIRHFFPREKTQLLKSQNYIVLKIFPIRQPTTWTRCSIAITKVRGSVVLKLKRFHSHFLSLLYVDPGVPKNY